jgi:hypothetical protein
MRLARWRLRWLSLVLAGTFARLTIGSAKEFVGRRLRSVCRSRPGGFCRVAEDANSFQQDARGQGQVVEAGRASSRMALILKPSGSR